MAFSIFIKEIKKFEGLIQYRWQISDLKSFKMWFRFFENNLVCYESSQFFSNGKHLTTRCSVYKLNSMKCLQFHEEVHDSNWSLFRTARMANPLYGCHLWHVTKYFWILIFSAKMIKNLNYISITWFETYFKMIEIFPRTYVFLRTYNLCIYSEKWRVNPNPPRSFQVWW